MKRFLFLLVLITTTACAQTYMDFDALSVGRIKIGLNGGAIEYDKDSTAFKIFFKNKSGQLDSAWLVISDRLSTPWAINLEARQRQDADGNLQSSINLLASIVHGDSASIEYALSQLQLKANKTYVDSSKVILEAQINLLAAAVDADSALIDYAMSQLLLKSNKTYVDSSKSELEALIELRATVGSVDTLNNRLDYATGQISTKANITKVDSSVTQIMAEVFLRARASYVDTIKTEQDSLIERVSIAEAGVTANASQIVDITGDVSDIQSSLLLYAFKDSLFSYINLMPGLVKIHADKIELDGTAIADSLFGQTIIAPIIRTSAAGAGLVLNGNTNRLEFLKSDGTVGSYLDAVGGNMVLNGTITNGVITNGVIQTAADGTPNQIKLFSDGEYGKILFADQSGSTLGELIAYTDLSNDDWIYSSTNFQANNIKARGFISATGNIATPTGQIFMGGNLVATQSWVNSQDFATTFTETDPTIYNWAKQSVKPSYSWSEITSKPFTSIGAGLEVDNGYLQLDFTPFDGAYSSLSGVPSTFTPASHGNEAHSATFLTTETDPNVPSYVKSITSQNITDWNWASAVVDALANVATSGSYNDLINKPTLFSGSYTDLTNKPTLFSGSYTDLTNKPTIPVITVSAPTEQYFGDLDIYVYTRNLIVNGTTLTTFISSIER
jgi:hypothetical protein